jgi:hypothetical protein
MSKVINYIKENSAILLLVAFALILESQAGGSSIPFVIGASGVYNRFNANLMNKEVDLEEDTIKVALMDDNHSFTATDNEWDDVSANEISGTGYTAGGEDLATKTVTQDATTKWDADDVEWSSATFSTYHAVLYDDTLTNDDLIVSIDFGDEVSVSSGTFKIGWDEAGIITLAQAS